MARRVRVLSTHVLASPKTLPSVHSVITDSRKILADEVEHLVAQRGADPELAQQLAKTSLARADAFLKLLKAAELLQALESSAAARTVDGKDLAALTDAQLRDLAKELGVVPGLPAVAPTPLPAQAPGGHGTDTPPVPKKEI
jgi:hypothetical protein